MQPALDRLYEPARQVALIGESLAIQDLHSEIDAAARSDAKVLIGGETGAGKELVAQVLHQKSARRAETFLTINCAGVPDSLLESELFGHARGSFTGAFRDSPGLVRQAHGGTVFLDEVGEMSLRMQAVLLRFLETGEVQTVGSSFGPTHADVRVVAASNRDLHAAVAAREFREDLYYRLNVLFLKVPSLRERQDDIEILVEHFAQEFSERHRTPPLALTDAARRCLREYAWPGNVRELRNVVERLTLKAGGKPIELGALPGELVARGHRAPARAGHTGERPLVSHMAVVESLLERMLVGKESFWTTVYPVFMAHDLTRDDLRFIVRSGLEVSDCSYRRLVDRFNMPQADHQRFLAFLKQHDCQLTVGKIRAATAHLRGHE